jgi:beta-glucosidase/6-phospho-beta-glucosidase/beta-galactosidase
MTLFNTFIMGGYECADHINRSGERVNLLKETQHDIRVEEDYEALVALGIKTVREGICWSAVEIKPNVFDFSEVHQRMRAAEKYGIQQIWDLIHFGYPDDIYPTHPHFCERFEQLCQSFATFYKEFSNQQLFVVPINEISFLSWHSGDVRGTVPFMTNSGWDIKYHLCKATILGIKVLKSVDPDCRIIMVEPLVKVHPSSFLEALHESVAVNEHQYQAMDIIGGRMCPELGGSEEYLDILGFNYYWNCQWKLDGEPLPWPEIDNIRSPLSDLLVEAYNRYKKPIFLSETGHFGSGRVQWLEEIVSECIIAQQLGVNLKGICIYPVTDRPDWDNLDDYSNCGIWDLDDWGNRIPYEPYVDAVLKAVDEIDVRNKNFLDDILKFFNAQSLN